MKFGLELNTQYPPDESAVAHLDENVAQVRAARDAGFDSVWAGQHYLSSPFLMFQPVPLLARMAVEAGDMRIGTNIFLLTIHNPVYTAEQVAMLDIITRGRFVFGAGLGYRLEEFAAFGVPMKGRGARFEECLEVVKRLWRGEEVTFRGQHVRLEQAQAMLRPVQQPHPPVWIGASGDAAVVRAARVGDAWLINPHAGLDTLTRQMELYRGTLSAANRPFPVELPIFKELSIAPTRDKALAVARPSLEKKYLSYAQWGLDKPMPSNENLNRAVDELARDRFIIGAPDECCAEIERYHRVLGVNHFILRLQWPGFAHSDTLRAIEMVGKYVIPALR
ncbi:MAG TPA: LLM class flavin-dependent oxidoreductase [Candidatus Methylomirabilis sp.]|nr:LLM class flavin-dependent oxidoreductase [Candidatus Methylomirabilis sp.]